MEPVLALLCRCTRITTALAEAYPSAARPAAAPPPPLPPLPPTPTPTLEPHAPPPSCQSAETSFMMVAGNHQVGERFLHHHGGQCSPLQR